MSRVSNLIKAARSNVGQKFVQPPLFVPMGCVTPETPKNETFKALYEAGIISRDDYEKALGGTYDIDLRTDKEDFDETFQSFEEFEDEFKLSELSQYYEDEEEGANLHRVGEATTSRETEHTNTADDVSRDIDRGESSARTETERETD